MIEAQPEYSDTNCGFLHGNQARQSPDGPDLCLLRLVAFLHAVPRGKVRDAGIALPELIVSLTLLGAGALGVAAIGQGAARMARIGAERSAQAIAATRSFEGAGRGSGTGGLDVAVDTVRIGSRLVEITVTVSGRGGMGSQTWATRRISGP